MVLNSIKSDSTLLKGFESKIKYTNDLLFDHITKYKKIHKKKAKNRIIGSSYSAVLIGNTSTYLFNIGDTRIYLFKDSNLKQLTYDDTVVWDLYKNNFITYDEAFNYQKGAKLTNYLGKTKEFNPEIISIKNDDYDYLYLLSDGITDYLDNISLQAIISVNSNNDILNEIGLLANSRHIKHDDISGCCYIKSKR